MIQFLTEERVERRMYFEIILRVVEEELDAFLCFLFFFPVT
jgi:hypothetical protein